VYFSALNSLYEFLSYEEDLEHNPIPAFRKRYLQDKTSSDGEERQLISVSEMAGLVLSVMKTRDKAVILLFAKTGVRRNELIRIDLQDIDWEEQSIKLKPTAKRTNQIVFFDDECARVLKKWINIRNEADPETDALFINQENDRLQRHGIYSVVNKTCRKDRITQSRRRQIRRKVHTTLLSSLVYNAPSKIRDETRVSQRVTRRFTGSRSHGILQSYRPRGTQRGLFDTHPTTEFVVAVNGKAGDPEWYSFLSLFFPLNGTLHDWIIFKIEASEVKLYLTLATFSPMVGQRLERAWDLQQRRIAAFPYADVAGDIEIVSIRQRTPSGFPLIPG
jgi:Site-specific recombinase XerD